MPIPRDSIDMDAVMERLKRRPRMSDAEMAADCERAQREYDEEQKKWLAQYDSEGHLKPGILGTSAFIPNLNMNFLHKTPEQQAAYIVAEKKRLGVLWIKKAGYVYALSV